METVNNSKISKQIREKQLEVLANLKQYLNSGSRENTAMEDGKDEGESS